MPLAPGASLGVYRVLSALGSGSMGEVYRAHDTRLKRDVALKVLPTSVARDPDRLSRFVREAQLLASLNHPHIVTIHSVEEVEGVPFLTMELVQGQPLDRIIATGRLPVSRLLDVATAIADALGRGACEGHRAPRPQARQRHAERRWARQGRGFRSGDGDAARRLDGIAPGRGRARHTRRRGGNLRVPLV